ncbi:DUF7162 family protein [Mycobacterium sp. 4D054]|uniref:DUF7162 family protein n=1 Tax=unclassified Mycobacterium TaxID=2642494 RepID=UPI0021B1766D|nr:hypothetical protein [Mycobacterium sp. SMC-8]UXA11303.1 hypothetical protein KXD97_25200 [Mycobacterium sp. SMC-8]
MGEIAHVDSDRVHELAGRFDRTAADIDDLRRPALEPAAMPGSAVTEVRTGELLAPHLDGVVTGLTGWAEAARTTVDAFKDADAANGDRFR